MGLARLRDELASPNLIYLDHALRGPLPRSALLATQRALESARTGSLARAEQSADISLARERLGRLLDWPSEGLAFTQNTTHAVSALAQAFPWSPGDRVVVHADEVPGNVLPWRALVCRGVELEVLPSRGGRLGLEDLEHALRGGGVRLVSLAAVALHTGERRDLSAVAALTRDHGAWLCVDAAQGAGALRLDLAGADAVCGSTRKWLLGPPDVGYLGIRPSRLVELEPAQGGAGSVLPDGSWRPDARRFEGGALPGVLFAGLAASLGCLLTAGVDALEEEVLARAREVAAAAHAAGWRVTSPGGQARSGVVHMAHSAGGAGLGARLRARGVVVRETEAGLRVSAHAWNTQGDVVRLFEALQRS